MPAVIVAVWLVLLLGLYGSGAEVRRAALAAFAIISALVLMLTEALSLFRALTGTTVLVGWAVVMCIAVLAMRSHLILGLLRARRLRQSRWDHGDWFVAATLGLFLVGTLAAALLYPVVNWDSLAYHMPRVFFWIQNQSTAFYPTADARQLFSSTQVEYCALHLKLLSGGSDLLVNLVQWCSYAASIAAVSLIAGQLGANRRGQQAAALAAAATPMAILQASTTQTDLTCAMWCLVVVSCVLEYITSPPSTTPHKSMLTVSTGLAFALAVASKSTAYVFCLPFLVWLAVEAVRREGWARAAGFALLGTMVVLGMGAPAYTRNARALDGDMLAVSAPSNAQTVVGGHTPQAIATTALKNLSMLVGTPSAAVNDWIASLVRTVIRSYGGDPEDPGVKVAVWGDYAIPASSFHHDFAPAPLSVLLILTSGAVLLALRDKHVAHAAPHLVCAGSALLIAAGLLTWQPWINRLLLGPILLLAPVVGVAVSASAVSGRRLAFAAVLGVLGLVTAWGAIIMTFNDTNRLVSMSVLPARSFVQDVGYWNTPSEDLAFRLTARPLARPLKAVAAAVEANGIERIGIDDRTGNVRIYLLLSLLPDTAFHYMRDTVLPERITRSGFEPQAIVEFVPVSQYTGLPEKGRVRGPQLLEPIVAGDVAVLLYAVP